jgi:tripartite ATP-independent transporter DctP family solute receptor
MRLHFSMIVFMSHLLFISSVRGEVQEIRFAHNGGTGSLFDICAQEFARRVNKRLAGAAKVAVYGDSQLGSDKEVLQKLQTGEIELALPSTLMSSVAPEFGVFELPFLIQNREQVRRFRSTLMQEFLRPAAEARGYTLLAMWENGFRHITTSTGPIQTPADLKGLRLRVPDGVWRTKMFKAYGAAPIALPYNEVYQGLKNKTIDAQENPLPQIYGGRFYETQKYLTLSKHVYTPAFLIGNKATFERMPAAVRDVIIETAAGMQDWVLDRGEKLDAGLIQKMRPYMAINEADPLAFTMLSLPIYQEYVSAFPKGSQLVKTIFETSPIMVSPVSSGRPEPHHGASMLR